MNVLIVEDDLPLARGLAQILESEGFAATLAENGEAAIAAARARPFELVILDIGFAGMDGFEVLQTLRGTEVRAPVLILTARDALGDRVRGLDLGADDYMTKPFAMAELIARARALIRRSHARAGARIVHGPLTLDFESRRAFLGDEPLDLVAREWAVLEALLVRAEKVVSKESIAHAIAGWNEHLSINAVEVYVSRLRAKLTKAGIRIRTVRGFGYMLEAYKP